jgi:hypothetical protein
MAESRNVGTADASAGDRDFETGGNNRRGVPRPYDPAAAM